MREQRATHVVQTQQRRAESTDFNGTSPHQAGRYTGLHPEDRPRTTTETRFQQQIRRQSPPSVQYQYDDGGGSEDDPALYDTRLPTSARRYQMPVTQGPKAVVRYHHQRQPVPPRRSRTTPDDPPVSPYRQQTTQPYQAPPQPTQAQARRQWHWSVYVGLTMLVGLTLYVLDLCAVTWWNGYQDDAHYGRPRTFQCDAQIGHDDMHIPSHFIALNLHKHVEVIEFPGGDATKAKVYIGPTLIGDGQDLTPVTLEFKDLNADNTPDMIVHIGKDARYVFLNDNGQFRPVRPSDNVTV